MECSFLFSNPNMLWTFEAWKHKPETDTGKIPVSLGYYSITFDETEMVRTWCYQNDVRSVDAFR